MKAALCMAVGLACTAAAAHAQEAPAGTRGLGFGVSLNGGALGTGTGAADRVRGGVGLSASYRASDRLSVFARTDYAYRAVHVDAGARLGFGAPGSALRPYVELAATRVASRSPSLTENLALKSTGYGATAGAGVEYFVARRLSLDAGVVHTEGRFTRLNLGGERISGSTRLSSTRLNVGFRWRP
jgi:opacity protein-like surface antigen